MIAAIRRLVQKDIFRVFSLTAISTIVKMITGFISIKIVSALIGPAGIALLGQFNNFSAIFLTFSTAGINTGVTKYVAEYSDSPNKVNLVLRTAIGMIAFMSILSGIVLIIGSTYFSKLILHSNRYSSIILIFGCTIVFYSLNSLLLAVLNGYKEFKKFVKINIISSVVGLLFSGTLAYYLGVYGALLAAVTLESVILLVTLSKITECAFFKISSFFGKWNKEILVKLSNYSLMALISAATVPVSQLIIRGSIVENSSLDDAGLWEAMNRLSAMYLLVITSSLSVYYLPRLSEIKTERELKKEIFSTYKFVIPPLLVFVLMIFISRHFIIRIVFNERFQGMESLFLFQLIGDFFKIGSWILAYQMLARSMTKFYVITEILGSILLVGSAIFLIQIFGNLGATMGYALTYICYFIGMVLIFRKLLFTHESK